MTRQHKRPQHLTQNHNATYPTRVVWFDCETRPEELGDGWEAHRLWFGWAAYRRRHRDGRWSRPRWQRFERGGAFWAWLDELTCKGTKLHVYAHNAGYDWTAARGWHHLPVRGWKLAWAVLDAPPFIVGWRKAGRSLIGVDTLNLWRVPLADIGARLDLPKLDMPAPNAPIEDWDTYCRRDVEIIMEASIAWWTWLEGHDLGGARETIASQALTAYRHRWLERPIRLDHDPEALSLARAAYHGGRVECWSLGHVPGPLNMLDVNSLYPHVMAAGEYPTARVGIYRGWNPERLYRATSELAVVADVELDTEVPAYPLYVDGRLIFPVGRFRSTLCTAELRMALERGHVVDVGQLAAYERAPIFRAWVRDLYALRREHADEGDAWGDWVCKRLMNALYGKFAQRGYRSEELGPCDPDVVHVETHYSVSRAQTVRIRWLAGKIEATWAEGEARLSQPIIAAEVTSYARAHLWSMIEAAGLEHVHYMDTDSLLVSDEGRARLEHVTDDTQLGALALELVTDDATIYGPKDYVIGERRRIKGVGRGAPEVETGVYGVETWLSIKGQLQRGTLNAPLVRRHRKRLKRIYRKGVLLPTGRTRPYTLPSEESRWNE